MPRGTSVALALFQGAEQSLRGHFWRASARALGFVNELDDASIDRRGGSVLPRDFPCPCDQDGRGVDS